MEAQKFSYGIYRIRRRRRLSRRCTGTVAISGVVSVAAAGVGSASGEGIAVARSTTSTVGRRSTAGNVSARAFIKTKSQ